MTQQINLFNPIFLKKENYFSSTRMVQGLALVLAGSILVVAYARIQLTGMRHAAEGSASQLKSTRAQLAKVTAEYTPREKTKNLDEEVRRMEAELKSQQQAYDIVQRGGIGNSKGYSEYLRAFARQIVNGVWLTDFTLSSAGNNIELKGKALQAELVPQYLARLKQEAVLKGKSFASLELQTPAEELAAAGSASSASKATVSPQYIVFTLKSIDEGVAHQPNTGPAAEPASVAGGDQK